ncbi:MAG TPA: hypothetical protein VJT31_04985 [Rugosimonospora sp.]|nr:hypothetical protein [Rugosimonospora sp.]
MRSHRAFTLEVVGLGGAAAIGGFCLLLYAVHTAAASAMEVLVLAGLAVVGAGLLLSVYGAKTPHPPANPASPTGRRPTPWRRKAEGLGVAASIAMTPLAMGVFGVFGQLIRFGRNLF